MSRHPAIAVLTRGVKAIASATQRHGPLRQVRSARLELVPAPSPRSGVSTHRWGAVVTALAVLALAGCAGLRGPNAETGLRGPNAETGLRGPTLATMLGMAALVVGVFDQ